MRSKKVKKRGKIKKDLINREKRVKIKSPYPELIVHQLLKKMIINSVYISFRNSIDRQINDYCYNYSKKFINSLRNFAMVEYDYDDVNDNESKNNWNDCPEPINPVRDRYLSTFVNVVKENNNNSDIISEKKVESTSNKRFSLSGNTWKNELNKTKKTDQNTNLTNELGKTKLSIGSNDTKYKNKKIVKGILPLEDALPITDIFSYPENEEIASARERYFSELSQSKNIQITDSFDKDSIISGSTKKNKNSPNIEMRKTKRRKNDINFAKYTFDPNGKLITLKRFEFSSGDNAFKTCNTGTKNIKNVKNPNDPRTPKKKKTRRGMETNNKEETDKVVVEYNLPKIKGKNGMGLKQMDTSNSINKVEIKIPAGDNFNLIKPEVGVKIQNISGDNAIKTGGLDFKAKFNRYSKKEYESFLDEANKYNLQNSYLNQSIKFSSNPLSNISAVSESSKINNQNTILNNNYNYNYNTISPLMDSIDKTISTNYHHNFNFTGKSRNLSFQNSMSEMIKLGKTINRSLKMTIDTIEPLTSINDSLKSLRSFNKQSFASTSNIFANQYKMLLNKKKFSIKDTNALDNITYTGRLIKNPEKVPMDLVIKKSNSTYRLPFKPDYFHDIKRNGIVVKPIKALRINFDKKVSQ